MSLASFFRISAVLIPFVVGIIRYDKIKRIIFLFYFVSFGVITEVFNKVLKKLGADNTLFIAHIYVVVSFALLCIFYLSVFKGYIKEIWFKSIILGFTIFSLIYSFYFQTIFSYPGLQLAVLAITMIVFSIIFLQKVMSEARIVKLSAEPLIWINLSILIYYSGNLFYYILFNLFLDNKAVDSGRIILIYFPTLNALFYILIAIGFWKAGKQKEVLTKGA